MSINSIRPFKRSTRIEIQIQKIVSNIFSKDNIIIDNCLVSVTKVELSKDIRVAKIFISIYSNNQNINTDSIFKTIIENRKIIKYKMGLNLKSKYVPDIEFIRDKSLESYDTINKLLKNNG